MKYRKTEPTEMILDGVEPGYPPQQPSMETISARQEKNTSNQEMSKSERFAMISKRSLRRKM